MDILGFKKEVFQGSWFLVLKFPGMKLSLLYSYLQEECHLVPEKQPNINKAVSPIEIFSLVTDFEELLALIVEQSNIYAHQNGRSFTITEEELKAFLGINFVMAISYPPLLNTGE